MATRYYTEEAYEQIKQTIEQIDNVDVSPVQDFLSDFFLRLGQFLKLYSVEQYQNDIQTWYNKVLDSHNSTVSQVDSIFNAVDSVDFEYRDIMDGAVKSIVSFRSTLNCLRDVISGKTSLADGKTAAAGYLIAGKNSLTASYDVILTRMEQGTLWDASKALFGDAIKLGAGYLKCMAGGNIADYKNLGDTILATGCDLLAMAVIVVTPFGAVGDRLDGKMDMSYEDYLDARFALLTSGQKLKDTNSISDLLGNLAEDMDEELANCPEDSPWYPVVNTIADISQTTADIYETVDLAVDLYGIGKDIKDIGGNIKMWTKGKDYSVGEFVDKYEFESLDDWKIIDISDGNNGGILKVQGTPSSFIKTVISNWTGLPASGWENPSKFNGNVLKVVGTLWSYGEKHLPDPVTGQSDISELPDVFFDKFKDTGFLKDVFDFARDTKERVASESIVLPGGISNAAV